MFERTAAPKGNVASLEESLVALEQAYVSANPLSRSHMEKSAAHLPGGNTRSILHFDPFPLVLAGGEGPRVRDVDGHVYTDFLGEYSAGLYGHSHPVIVEAVKAALDGGIVLGGTNPYEFELARLMTARFPSLDRIRFCNSGTEANMLALCLARAATGRAKVLVFSRCLSRQRHVVPRQGRHPQFAVPRASLALQRPRSGPPDDRRQCRRPRRRDPRADDGRRRLHSGRGGFPARPARRDGQARHRADLRRGDDVAHLARRVTRAWSASPPTSRPSGSISAAA